MREHWKAIPQISIIKYQYALISVKLALNFSLADAVVRVRLGLARQICAGEHWIKNKYNFSTKALFIFCWAFALLYKSIFKTIFFLFNLTY